MNEMKRPQGRSPQKALAKIIPEDKGHILRSKSCLGMLRTELGIIQETQCTEMAREMATEAGTNSGWDKQWLIGKAFSDMPLK